MAKILGTNGLGGSLLAAGNAVLAATGGGKVLGKVSSKVSSLTSDPVLGKIVSQGWRNALFLARALSNKPKNNAIGPDPAMGKVATLPMSSIPSPKDLIADFEKKYPKGISKISINEYVYEEHSKKKVDRELFDLKANAANNPGNSVIIYNTTVSPYQYIILQNRPPEITSQGQTSWAEIKSMGRNLPMYHYLGGQDEIHINLSWFCNDPNNPDEVLVKCRLLESWTKSNGYQSGPPVLRIQWGSSELFKDQWFILTSATYTLGNFRSVVRDYRKPSQSNGAYNGKLNPGTATQELILKRVSGLNPSHKDYVSSERLKAIKGIGYQEEQSQTSTSNV